MQPRDAESGPLDFDFGLPRILNVRFNWTHPRFRPGGVGARGAIVRRTLIRSPAFGRDLRIVFEYTQHEGQEAILLLASGTHDEIY